MGAPTARIIHGDCIEAMREMPANSVDSIVTDPPYGLGFMGKKWDDLPPGREWAEECLRVLKPGGHLLAFGGTRTWHRLAVAIEDAGFEMRDSIAWLYGSGFPKHRAALKPAFEPVVMARKPFKGSLAANEAVHGTGALDIDGCRIEADSADDLSRARLGGWRETYVGPTIAPGYLSTPPSGRWPANVILDEGMAEFLDENNTGGASRFFKIAKVDEFGAVSEVFPREFDIPFMYTAKASKKERPVIGGVSHPTVKPLTLMRYLVKLVTPPNGNVLEPFAGSGATVEACILEGFDVIAIEREAEYLPLIEARIERTEAA